VLKHPSIGEIPAPMKQRLGLSPGAVWQERANKGRLRSVPRLGKRDGFWKHWKK